ncbi:hypothetical protein [Bradyrhizobium sp. Ai1a-2]|uniref:hypothetical protein n=1 Tax=Bradyrhizobium sp. Ai1a-2 TaxID=196490 RepID=UPI0004073B0D|nr:hypothetical protein [Bradyrhizobium sp. Ai1a-2]
MKFNDTAPLLPKPAGPPPWLAKLAEDATLEGAVLKRPVQGRETIVALLKEAIPLYEFQNFTYRGDVGESFFMESYRAQIQGVPVECAVWVHMNAAGEADAILINHHPLDAALLFSRLMWERVGDRYGDLYLTGAQAAALAATR